MLFCDRNALEENEDRRRRSLPKKCTRYLQTSMGASYSTLITIFAACISSENQRTWNLDGYECKAKNI